MYCNLEAEMARKGITRGDIAKVLSVTQNTISAKLNGKNDLSLPECFAIKEFLGVKMTIDELFKNQDTA